MSMNIEQIIEWILKNGDKYPGKHNQSTMRTEQSMKPLQPKAQYLIIWKSFTEYIMENIQAGRSVNVKNFGCFTYDCVTELPKIADRAISPKMDIFTKRTERANIHHLKPVFVVDPKIQYHLVRFNGKEQISPAISQHSIYQKGFRTIYANPVPVAQGAAMGKDVTVDALETLFRAIIDLIKYDKNIDLAFGFANVRLYNRKLSFVFKDGLVKEIKAPTFEHQMARQKSPVSTLWTTSYDQKWGRSTLGSLVKKPNGQVTQTLNEKTQALKIMSFDLSSSGKFGLHKF